MALERRYVEEVGEAVEALGIMLERELGAVRQGLVELYRSLSQMRDEEKNLQEETQKLKAEMEKTQKVLRRLETAISRTESKLMDQQIDSGDEEEAGEIKNDLLVIRKELQFARSDLTELLKTQGSSGRD
jgi:chromosome segregation ATPase